MIPRLVVITDWAMGEAQLFRALEAALGSGVSIAIQHRDPEATTRVYFERGLRLKALCERFSAPMFVSARVDLAIALGAHLHLPARALPATQVREALPRGRWISVAVHDEAEVRAATGADFALVSPVFETSSKPGAAPLGAEGFARLAAHLPCPAYALGGVRADRLHALRGCAGAAVISAVLRADDPATALRELAGALSPADESGESIKTSGPSR